MHWLIALVPILVVGALVLGGTVIGQRHGTPTGRVVVRCREGHLFTTVWIPFASFKAIRLGWVRAQRCPVGNHWTFVTPVRDEDLTDSERRLADQFFDGPIP